MTNISQDGRKWQKTMSRNNNLAGKSAPDRLSKGTSTSAFGTVNRRGHDSSSFYSKKIYSEEKLSSVLNSMTKDKLASPKSANTEAKGKVGQQNKTKTAKKETKKKISAAKYSAKNTAVHIEHNRAELPATNIIYCADSRKMRHVPEAV